MTSTKQIVEMSKKYKAKLHLLHVSTEEEMEYLYKNKYDEMSVEVTPQHLSLFAPDCYDQFGTHAQMNPPIRAKRHQEALWKALNSGLVDTLGSDHAPHTKEEKAKGYPKTPSGIPGVQTTLPLMLSHVAQDRLSLQKLVELFSLNPAKLFNLEGVGEIHEGRRADLTVVDLKKKETISSSWLAGKVGWSPFEGQEVQGWPVMTIVSGAIACRDGEVLGRPMGKAFSTNT